VAVNILITGVGADYTSLSSFGTVDAFAENLVIILFRRILSKAVAVKF
jgi:hypothetical protein